ncbi:farnesyltransferase subunit beta protein [Nymphaea thermarum]|nr:farnesyltransferase subunit beta protein [Nymphaea thermarum]
MEGVKEVHLQRLTVSQKEQLKVEERVSQILSVLTDVSPHTKSLMLELWNDKHIEFLMAGLRQLGPSYCVLDANRPWLCYWILHSAALLGEYVDAELEQRAIDFISRCQDVDGGYGGGPGQMPHLATTYAAVNSLITLGGISALSSINREKMHMFLMRMKDPSGGFRMHEAGEMDVRACYTAISVASILSILSHELVENVGSYISSCQTYEGGIAGEPDSEAHGGYTFCGLATLILINEVDCLDLPQLLDWVVFRQGEIEGGFQGRANKLVDGCYSFWQGGALALLQKISLLIDKQLKMSFLGSTRQSSESTFITDLNLSKEEKDTGFSFLDGVAESGPLFDPFALQHYILLCSQVLEGGFKDKPGKHRDYYHTCYCLSGLSVCQHSESKAVGGSPKPTSVLGPFSNLLEPIHPLFNVILDRYYEAHDFFSRM